MGWSYWIYGQGGNVLLLGGKYIYVISIAFTLHSCLYAMNPFIFPTLLSRSHLLATMVSMFIVALTRRGQEFMGFGKRGKMRRWTEFQSSNGGDGISLV